MPAPYAIDVRTVFTDPDGKTHELLPFSSVWRKLTLFLETAGPVAVGDKADLGTPISGNGRLLPVKQDAVFTIPPNCKFYIASGAVNRIGFQAEPIPWGEDIWQRLGEFMTAASGKSPKPTTPDIGHFGFTGMPKGVKGTK